MSNLLRMTGRVLGWFLLFDLAGVVLTQLVDVAIVLHRRWEGSSPLAYVIWFVIGVFCAACIHGPPDGDGYDSPAGRRSRSRLVVVTAAVAVVLGLLASWVWSGSDASQAVAPVHRGVTLTYLATVVLFVALARFVLFREGTGAGAGVGDAQAATGPSIEDARLQPEREPVLPAARSRWPRTPEELRGDPAAFKPAGFWQTLGFVVGVPVLLFLDASTFLLGPFEYFDRVRKGGGSQPVGRLLERFRARLRGGLRLVPGMRRARGEGKGRRVVSETEGLRYAVLAAAADAASPSTVRQEAAISI